MVDKKDKNLKLEISGRHLSISLALFGVMIWGFVEAVVFTHPLIIIPSVLGLVFGAWFIGAIIDEMIGD